MAKLSQRFFFFLFSRTSLNLSKVLFLGLLNASSHLVRNSCSVTVATLISGSLSVRLFLPAVPSGRKRTLITFLSSAASSLRLFIRAKFGACSVVTILNNLLTDNEYLAVTATVKRSHQSSQSVLGAASAESQCAGNPNTADALPDFATSPQFADSRSAMLYLETLLNLLNENNLLIDATVFHSWTDHMAIDSFFWLLFYGCVSYNLPIWHSNLVRLCKWRLALCHIPTLKEKLFGLYKFTQSIFQQFRFIM